MHWACLNGHAEVRQTGCSSEANCVHPCLLAATPGQEKQPRSCSCIGRLSQAPVSTPKTAIGLKLCQVDRLTLLPLVLAVQVVKALLSKGAGAAVLNT